MINASFEAMDTPSKKRKRESLQKFVSSTPIKMNNNCNNKENFVFSDSCMEVKSIADLVAERRAFAQVSINEYEVIRKPPKKKKRPTEESCFVNPGLDLKVDDKFMNPFEIVRDDNTEAMLLAKGVSNPALDIKNEPETKPNMQISTNPFEVKREEVENLKTMGIENSALDLNNPVRTALVLPLPFTPTVNYRIDFSNMPENLTPSALLSTKLVLENNEAKITPIDTPKNNTTVTKALSVISEEEIDIGEELDNYQLQLENSINEAKIQNKQYEFDSTNSQTKTEVVKERINNETFTKEILKTIEESTKNIGSLSGLKESSVDCDDFYQDDINDDVQFEEVDSFEDAGKLGQFKRAYRTEAAQAAVEFKKPSIDQPVKKTSKLGISIRRSIRKLIHPKISTKCDENFKSDESEPKHDGIFQTIRQSLRRKHKPKVEEAVNLETTMVGRQVYRETINGEIPKRTLERQTLKRNIVKTVRTFMESVDEFDHY